MMQLTRDIINKHSRTHRPYEYYETIIKKVEENVNSNPDISIESSKSLIEGVCMTICCSLDKALTEKKAQNMSFPKLFSTACEYVDEHILFETDFVHRTSSMIARLGELRNERGDISHGKAVPKKHISSRESAKMIMHVTDSIVAYILGSFFSIDLSYKVEIQYDTNSAFNALLDESYPLEGISYSKALFEQDYDSYEEQLRDYLDNVEE